MEDIKKLITHCAPKLPSSEEMAAMDAATINSGVPGRVLMEKAGEAVFRIVLEIITASKLTKKDPILCVAGPGNNGGDGFVISRLLQSEGYSITTVLAAAESYSKELTTQLEEYQAHGGSVLVYPSVPRNFPFEKIDVIAESSLASLVEGSALIIDALLGTGQRSAPRGGVAALLQSLSHASKRAHLVSVDIPTGVNADTGEVYPVHAAPTETVCIELLKRGLVQFPGRDVCGRTSIVSVGIDTALETEVSLLQAANVPRLPLRSPNAFKNRFGHVLVVGGSRNMPGAPLLSALSALRAGAGLVSKAQLLSETWDPTLPEVMLEVVDDSKHEGVFGDDNFEALAAKASHCSSVVLGPGIGTAELTKNLTEKLLLFLSDKAIPLVLDADGLNCLSEFHRSGKTYSLRCAVLTPHPGEMARLLDISGAEVERDRYGAAKSLSRKTGAVVVLKGAATVIHDGTIGFVNTTGNPFLATAGSGDVLSGIIGGFMAQGLSPLDAALSGVFSHGRAGDLAHYNVGGPITASDISRLVPKAVSELYV